MVQCLEYLNTNTASINMIPMRSRKALERLYGSAGADVAEAVPGVMIATDGNRVIHVHLRESQDITDNVFRLVAKLTDLEELVANKTSISNASLAYIRALPKLRLIHLSGTAISNAGIGFLLQFPLVLLDLSDTHISDMSLQCLSGIKSLQELWIIGCPVSERGIRHFQEQVPMCKVYR